MVTHKKLARHKHLFDSFGEIVKFETFSINNLKQNNISIYRTDQKGEITIKTDGKNVNITSQIE